MARTPMNGFPNGHADVITARGIALR